MRTLTGKMIAPGLADGTAVVLLDTRWCEKAAPAADTHTEVLRLQRAFHSARVDLEALQLRVHQEFGANEAEIFVAHQLILEDPTLRDDIIERIKRDGLRAEKAIAASVDDYAARLNEAQDPYLRERGSDIRDIGDRLIRHASGHPSSRFSALGINSIIVAEELMPSDLVELDSERLVGVVTERCGETSHVAILARALGIPAVTGMVNVTRLITSGQRLLLDSNRSELTIDPGQTQVQSFRKRRMRFEEKRLRDCAQEHLPCKTADGTDILLMANLARPNETELCAAANLQGVGLLRTEFLFLDHAEPPSVQEQVELYTQVAKRMAGREVYIRTLDLGGDKYPLFLYRLHESNPTMGLRGLRFSLSEGLPLFQSQVEALLRVSSQHSVGIMLPMVLGVDDLLSAKDIVSRISSDLAIPLPPIGVLVETPAAVLVIDEILDCVDFVSIGTNDLTQFVLASDRNALDSEEDYYVLHPAVLRAVSTVSDAARSKNTPVTVCGEAAGVPGIAALLVGLGIRRLSMSPSLSGRVKHTLRSQHLEKLELAAKEALVARSIVQIREIVASLG